MKKNKTQCAAVVSFCAILATSSLTGCGDSKSEKKDSLLDPKNPTTVTVWNYYNGDQLTAFEKLVTDFNDTIGAEKGIVVQSASQGDVDTLANSLIDSINGKVGATDIPSIASIYAETAYILNQQEAIVPLDSYFTEDELSEYIPSFLEDGRLTDDGELYLFPVSKSTEAFIVNATDWADFGAASGITPDSIKTNEDLKTAAEAYYKWSDSLTPDIPEDGKALYGRDSVANYIFIGTKQLGHEMFTVDKNGKLTVDLDRDTFKTLWDNYYVPYINGYFGSYGKYRSEDIKTGAIIAMTGSTSGVSYIPTAVTDTSDVSHDIDISIRKSLNFANTAEDVSVQQGAGYSILKTNDAEEYASAEFLKWFTDTKQNLDFSISSGYSPVKTEANDAEKITDAFTVDSPKAQNMLDALLVSSNIYTSSETYTCPPFNGSKDVRDVLSAALTNTAVNDRAAVLEKLASGATREEAVSEYTTDEYFDTWFQNLCTQVNSIVS